MTKNPILNALSATLYITLITTIMNIGSRYAPKEDSFLAPVAFISIFTLSAAVMAYIFGKEPLLLWFDGKKKEGLKLFLHTLISFAVITLIILFLVFSGTIK